MPEPQHSFEEDFADDSGSLVASSKTTERSPGNNLPLELSTFVGRGKEISEIKGLLADHRLLTLTGPGGSGKTRLALRVAAEVADSFLDGVWLVELASLSDPDLVPQAVAAVLSVREVPGESLAGTLADRLRSRSLLLVLDNCEHLVDACASLAQALLRGCPNLSILATSREALGVPGEALFTVPPLSLPDPWHLPAIESMAHYEAAMLFVERARAARPDFGITEQNAMAVAQVCYRLDGIPLAIELAAARVKMLSVEQISSRLEGSLALLAGGGRTELAHHRTLRATMDWSHELLGQSEKVLFRRLSVFAGSWTLEAAEAVCAGGNLGREEILDLLSRLVDKSLVLAREQDGAVRYRFLETVRQFGEEKLGESGEAGEVQGRHAGWYLHLAEEAEPLLKGHRQIEWLKRLETEHDNLRAAMRTLLREGEVEAAVRLSWALWLFWYLHGHQGEGHRYTAEALEKGSRLPAVMRARALCVAGITSHGLESVERMGQLFEESVALFRHSQDRSGLAIALSGVGVTALQQGDTERATALLKESLKLHREAENKFDISNVLVYLGMVPLSRGDHEQAAQYFEEALALSREVGDRLSGYTSLYSLAFSSRVRGDHERAAQLYTEGLRLAVEAGDKANAAYCLEGLAGLIAGRGEPERATQLFAASETLLDAVGAPLYAHAQDRALYDSAVETLRSRLGEEAFGTAWAEGREMSIERAAQYALEPPQEAPEEPSILPVYPADLSVREVEVLRLVARGMTNAQIAKELFISPRTVNAHLGSVYHKIGSNTRAEATRFAAEHDLL